MRCGWLRLSDGKVRHLLNGEVLGGGSVMERPETKSLDDETMKTDTSRAGSPQGKRRKAAAVGILILMGAAFFDSSILDGVQTTASDDAHQDQSEIDAFEQVELMLAQAEAQQPTTASDGASSAPSATHEIPRQIAQASPTLMIPPLNGATGNNSETPTGRISENSPEVPVQPVSRPVDVDSLDDSQQQTTTSSGSSGAIRLTGTIAPLP